MLAVIHRKSEENYRNVRGGSLSHIRNNSLRLCVICSMSYQLMHSTGKYSHSADTPEPVLVNTL